MRKINVILLCLFIAVPSFARIITVDDDAPADFDNIQAAIDDADNGDTVVVADGNYTGTGNRDIDFLGKAITVRSENGPTNCIIDCNATESDHHRGFYFHNYEGGNSVVVGFTITKGFASVGGGIYCYYSSPTISNCLVTDNTADGWFFGGPGGGNGIACYHHASPKIYDCIIKGNNGSGDGTGGGGVLCQYYSNPTITNSIIEENSADYGGGILCFSHSNPLVLNCTIYNNEARYGGGGIYAFAHDYPKVYNSILWDNTTGEITVDNGLMGGEPSQCKIRYSDVKGGEADIAVAAGSTLYWESGNINVDPLFDDADASDFHLKSQAGRWNPNSKSWVTDSTTSPCIDAGNLTDPIGLELFPNGGFVNMGAYGGTAEASKSYFGTTPCETIVAGDINGDCIIDFRDFAFMALHWLENNSP